MAGFSDLIASAKKKLYDNQGIFQQGRFTPLQAIPQVKQANQAIINNAVKPFATSLYNTAKPIINYVDPRGYQAERTNPQLGNQKFFSAAQATVPTAVNLFGAMKGGITAPIISGAISGGINKLTGGSFKQGFQSGVAQSPTISGIGAFTNPLINKGVGTVASKFTGSIVNKIAPRIASGLGNIPEGYLMSKGLGQSYSPKQAAFDFATGATLQAPPSGGIRVKGARATIDPQTLNEVDTLRDVLNRAIKGEKIDLGRAYKDVDNIASKWLDKSEIDNIVSKSRGKQLNVYYRNTLDAIAKKVGEYNPRYGGFQMNFTNTKKYEQGLDNVIQQAKSAEEGAQVVRNYAEDIIRKSKDTNDLKALRASLNRLINGSVTTSGNWKRDYYLKNFDIFENPDNLHLKEAVNQIDKIDDILNGRIKNISPDRAAVEKFKELGPIAEEAKKYKSAEDFAYSIGQGTASKKMRDAMLTYKQKIEALNPTQQATETSKQVDKDFIDFYNQITGGKKSVSPDRARVEQNLNPTQKDLGRAMIGSVQEDRGQKMGVDFNKVITNAKKEIGRPEDKGVSIKQHLNEFYTDWVNKFHPVESLTSSIEKATGKAIDTVNNPKYTIKRLLGAGGTAELRHKRELEPIISQLGNVDRSDFDVFMKAQRDVELSNRGIIGSSATLAKQRLEALRQKYDLGKMEQVANQLYAYQRKGLEKLKQAGFLSDQAVSNITAQNQKYVPFQRISAELDNYLGVPSSKLQQASTPVQKIKGSDKAIESPLESVIANTYKIEAAIAKNNVARSIVGLSKVAPEYKTLFQRVEKSGADTIAVWNNGKKEFYKAPDEVVKVVKGLNEENTTALVNILSIPAKFFRQQTTGRNPAFFIPNMVRDQFDAAINAKYGYIPFFDYARGLTHLIKDKYGGGDELVQQWMKSGGALSFDAMGGRKAIRQQIQDATQEKKLIQKAIDMFVGGVDTLGEFSEVPTRLGVFKRALDKTGNTDIAAYESREATMDFSRMGAKMKTFNSIVPFLNVGVQGFDKMIRVAKDNPAKLGMAMAGYALFPQTMVSIYNNLFHGEDYAKVPDFEKESNFILLTGQKDREGMPIYAKIPKGHTQQLLTAPMDNLITYLYSNNPQSFQQMALSMLSGALPVLGDGDNLGDIFTRTVGENTPQAFKPIAEVALNKNTFRNKPIVDPYTEKLPPAAQFYASTPEEYKKLGQQLNMSPAKLQYLAEGYGGGLSKEMGNLKSTAQDALAGNPLDINKVPLVRRFVGSYSGFDTDRPQAMPKEEVQKAVQDRQAKLELKNSNETSKRVGNTLYIKRTDKNGKVSVDTKELPTQSTPEKGIQKQGFLNDILKPAPKFEPKQQPKTDAEKKAELDAVKAEFKLSDEKVKKYDNYVLIKKGDKINTIELNRKIEEPKLTGNATLDKKLISQYKSELTSKSNEIVSLYEAGVLTKNEAEQKLIKLNDLSKAAGKKVGIGTGKKKFKISKITFPKTKITPIKLAKIKVRSPKIKVTKPKKYKFKIAPYRSK